MSSLMLPQVDLKCEDEITKFAGSVFFKNALFVILPLDMRVILKNI